MAPTPEIAPPADAPLVLPRSQHPISRQQIDTHALKVLYRLHRSGYRGLMVGGSVRDLMLGRQPKDFDVTTDARPHELRRVFRNSRVIGRRFRLVHVFFHDGIVEVATFRREPSAEEGEAGDLLITDDNQFGTAREDAFRRDFTINGLFYDIADFSVLDYVGGVRDLAEGVVRTIGDADVRYQEDPVRMLRACELAARLDFTIDAASQEAIRRHARLLERAAPARVTEEIVDLLRSGAAADALDWMARLELLPWLLPEAAAAVGGAADGEPPFPGLLTAVDRSMLAGDEASDGGLLAALLLPRLLLDRERSEAGPGRPWNHLRWRQAITALCGPVSGRLQLSRARAEGLEQALATFVELADDLGKPAQRARLGRRPSFRDALWLLARMVDATGEGEEILTRWRDVERQVGRSDHPPRRPARTRRRRSRR